MTTFLTCADKSQDTIKKSNLDLLSCLSPEGIKVYSLLFGYKCLYGSVKFKLLHISRIQLLRLREGMLAMLRTSIFSFTGLQS